MGNARSSRKSVLRLAAGVLLATGLLVGVVWGIHGNPVAHASGTIRYVAPTGSDSGSCDNSATPCATLQYAVDRAEVDDEIRLAGGTYTGVSDRPRDDVDTTGNVTQLVYISTTLAIRGGYTLTNWIDADPVAHPTVLDAQDQGRVIYITQGAAPILENLWITGGDATNLYGGPSPDYMDAGGGVYAFRATLTMSNCVVVGNTASTSRLAWGGGVFLYEGANAEFTGNSFTGNISSHGTRHGRAGGLGLHNSSATLTGNTFTGNIGASFSGGWGGAAYLRDSGITMTGNDVSGNTASTSGNSIYVGHGGGLLIYGGTATLTGNTIQGNLGGTGGRGDGGGLHAMTCDVTLTGNTISENTGSAGNSANGGGVYVSGGSATLVSNTIISNTGSTGDYGYGGGVSIELGVNPLEPAVLQNNTVRGNRCSTSDEGIGGGVKIDGGVSLLSGNWVEGNTAGVTGYGRGGGIYLHSGHATLEGNTVISNTAARNSSTTGWGGGLMISSVAFTLTNNVVAGNTASTQGGGLYLQFPSNFSPIIHNTIADNAGAGAAVYLNASYYSPGLTNTIISGHPNTGITATTGSVLSLDSTLWYGNGATTGGPGTIQTTHDYSGDPVFVNPAAWDYHIGAGSEALDRGVGTVVDSDIDAQPRPAGSAPDLGADELLPDPSATASKTTFAPQWAAAAAAGSGQPYGQLVQRYLIEFSHYDPDPAADPLTLVVTDTLPTEIAHDWDWHTPQMALQQQGQTLRWETLAGLPSGQMAQILVSGVAADVEPLAVLTNTAVVSAGQWRFDLQAQTEVPLFPPQIISPGSGEMCPVTSGDMAVSGLALPNELVEVYEGAALRATTTADAGGVFTATYVSSGAGGFVTLTARTCLQSSPTSCSEPSEPVSLVPPASMFCPQQSTWEDTPTEGPLAGQHLVYRFRNREGRFVSNGWDIVAPFSFSGTQLHLVARSCPPGWGDLTAVWVTIEDYGSFYPVSSAHPLYEFEITAVITEGYHEVRLSAMCGPGPGVSLAPLDQIDADGDFAVSREGIVFDVTAGLDPGDPSLNAVPGVTVTLMVSQSEWGGWVPWPAHAYDGQENPQVTGADGSFAFLAPGDRYYLQVEGPAAYQPWRSPVFTDTTRINVPLTPWHAGADAMVSLGLNGPQPAMITVPAGSVVEWAAALDAAASVAERMALIDNPALRPRSWGALDPLSSTLGFDGGMVIPGGVYRRAFAEVGTYDYTDGAGHSGQVVVTGSAQVFLPLVLKDQ